MLKAPNAVGRIGGVALSSLRARSIKRGGRLDAGPVSGGVGISSLRASSGTAGGILSRTGEAIAQATERRVSLLDLPADGGKKALELGTPVRRTSALTAAFARAAARLHAQPTTRGVLPQEHQQSRRQMAGLDGRGRLLQRWQPPLGLEKATGITRTGDRISILG